MTEEQIMRQVPRDNLDLNLMLTDTLYGSKTMSEEFRENLVKRFVIIGEDGNPVLDAQGRPVVKIQAGWEMLEFYTRDMRLGFIDQTQFRICRHYIDLAGDCYQEEYFRAFLTALRRAITIIELSQSYKGNLRKNTNTLRSEQTTRSEPVKKPIMPGGK